MEMCGDAQRCTEVHRGAQRCTEGCAKVCRGVQRCAEVCRGARKGVQGGAQAMKGQVGKKADPCGSAQVPRSWKLGKMVWWAHRKYSNHRIIGATRAGFVVKFLQAKGNMDGQARPNVAVQPGSECVWRCRCSAECCRRLMGGGGHIVSAPTKQEGASRASVHMQGLCDLAWCAWCRLGGGRTQSSTRCKRYNRELGAQTAMLPSLSPRE